MFFFFFLGVGLEKRDTRMGQNPKWERLRKAGRLDSKLAAVVGRCSAGVYFQNQPSRGLRGKHYMLTIQRKLDAPFHPIQRKLDAPFHPGKKKEEKLG